MPNLHEQQSSYIVQTVFVSLLSGIFFVQELVVILITRQKVKVTLALPLNTCLLLQIGVSIQCQMKDILPWSIFLRMFKTSNTIRFYTTHTQAYNTEVYSFSNGVALKGIKGLMLEGFNFPPPIPSLMGPLPTTSSPQRDHLDDTFGPKPLVVHNKKFHL